MSILTKEGIQKILNDDWLLMDDCEGLENCTVIKELARMALAAMDSESNRNPVLAYADSYRDMAKQGVESVPIWSVITDLERNIAPLYRHAQQPVVPDAYVRDERGIMMLNGVCEPKIGFGSGWNACRAAMLQGVEPVTPAYKSPDDFDFDRFNDVVWLEAVASNPHMHSPTTSTIAMVALGLNRKLADCNSPVIPNGWKLVPIDPTKDMLRAGQSVVGFWLNTVHCYSKMLAAAPAAPRQEA